MEVKEIEWSKTIESNDKIPYTHVIGVSPLGEFAISWKGWKESPSYDIEYSPIEDFGHYGGEDLEDAKKNIQEKYSSIIKSCLITAKGSE